MVKKTILWMCFAIVALLIWKLLLQASLLLHGTRSDNATLYWAMGRAMLNGREIYGQIFENKPPGIFLLSAGSLWFTGGTTLGNIVNTGILLGWPLAVAYGVWNRSRALEHMPHLIWATLGFLLGGMLGIFSVSHAGGWETEYLGSFFAGMYALSILPSRPSWKHTILQTALLLCAIGLKEPFLLITLASAILLCQDRKAWMRQWLLPVVLALLIGTTVLFVLGIADGYTGIYLPLMLAKRVGGGLPLWIRAISLHRVAIHLWEFSIPMALSAATLLVANFLLMFRLNKKSKKGLPLLLGLVLTFLAIGAGGDYQTHHFVLVAPFLLVLFLRLQKSNPETSLVHLPQNHSIVFAALALPLVLFSLLSPIPKTRALLQNLNEQERALKEDATRIDAILDACALEGYFFVQGLPIYGYTRHTPENFFLFAALEHTLRYSPAVVERTAQNLANAKVLVLSKRGYTAHTISVEESEFAALVQRYILDRFSQESPSCAATLPRPKHHSLLFRIDPNDLALPFTYGTKTQ